MRRVALWVAGAGVMGVALLLGALRPASRGPPPTGPVLLAVAHPDDETLFFAPTLLDARRRCDAQQHEQSERRFASRCGRVYVLSLSAGNASGLGAQRMRELRAAAAVLGLPPDRVFVAEEPLYASAAGADPIERRQPGGLAPRAWPDEDGPAGQWSAADVACTLAAWVRRVGAASLLTFDAHGVTQHANHIALHRGAAQLAAAMPQLDVLQLESTSLWRKYTAALDAVLAGLLGRGATGCCRPPATWCVWGDIDGWWQAVRAMTAHGSQLTWYRWLYLATSRYLWTNAFSRIVPDPAGGADACLAPLRAGRADGDHFQRAHSSVR